MGKSHLFQVSTDSFFVCCDEGGVEEMGILAMIFLGDACFKQLQSSLSSPLRVIFFAWVMTKKLIGLIILK